MIQLVSFVFSCCLRLVSLGSRSTWLNFCRTTGAVVSSFSLSFLPFSFCFCRWRARKTPQVTGGIFASFGIKYKILLKSSMSRNYVIVDLGVENQSVLLPLQFHISFAIAPVKLNHWFDLIWYLFVFEFKMACAICRSVRTPPAFFVGQHHAESLRHHLLSSFLLHNTIFTYCMSSTNKYRSTLNVPD